MNNKLLFALWIKTDGEVKEVRPENGRDFTLEEMYKYTGCTCVDILNLPSGRAMIVDDNGKNEGRKYNENASQIFREEYPIEKYPMNNDQTIVGDVLVSPPDMVK